MVSNEFINTINIILVIYMLSLLSKALLEQDVKSGLTKCISLLSSEGIMADACVYFISPIDAKYKKIAGGVSGKDFLPINFEIDRYNTVSTINNGCLLAFITGQNVTNLEKDVRILLKGILLHFFELNFSSIFYKEIRKPIDFTSKETYFLATAELLSAALCMPMVAIRRLTTDDNLQSLCFYKKGKESTRGCSFHYSDMPPPFSEVINESELLIEEHRLDEIQPAIHSNIDLSNPKYSFLKKQQADECGGALEKGETFVIFPIFYDHVLYGVISCASFCRYVYSEVQKKAISGLMQIIGVAISNFLRYHEAQELHEFQSDEIFDGTALEVAKSTKHELINSYSEVSATFLALKTVLKKEQKPEIPKKIEEMEQAVDRFLPSINKLAFGDRADKEFDKTSIKKIWDQSTDLFKGRIKRYAIKISFQGPSCEGEFCSNMLKNAFLNLILNSIDSFISKSKKNRKIILVTTISPNGQMCTLDYSDNAGGLNMAPIAYKIPEHTIAKEQNMSLKELIFLPKVTSKDNVGSGWGLYLVRRAITLHKGSINLTSYKNGCTFRITMPLKPEN